MLLELQKFNLDCCAYTERVQILSSKCNVIDWSTKHNISSDRINQEVGAGVGIRIQVVSHNIVRRLKKVPFIVYIHFIASNSFHVKTLNFTSQEWVYLHS